MAQSVVVVVILAAVAAAVYLMWLIACMQLCIRLVEDNIGATTTDSECRCQTRLIAAALLHIPADRLLYFTSIFY